MRSPLRACVRRRSRSGCASHARRLCCLSWLLDAVVLRMPELTPPKTHKRTTIPSFANLQTSKNCAGRDTTILAQAPVELTSNSDLSQNGYGVDLFALFGLFGLFVLFGLVRSCSGLFGLVRACSGLFGLVRACSGLFGLVRACSGLFGLVVRFVCSVCWLFGLFVCLFVCLLVGWLFVCWAGCGCFCRLL